MRWDKKPQTYDQRKCRICDRYRLDIVYQWKTWHLKKPLDPLLAALAPPPPPTWIEILGWVQVQSRNQTRILSSPQRSPAVFLRATQYWWLCLVCTCPNSIWFMTMVNLEYHFLSNIQQNKLLWWTNNSRKYCLKGKRSIYKDLQ